MKSHFSWIARAGTTASVWSTATIALLDPESQHGAALSVHTTAGIIAACLIYAFVGVSLLDILVNDWLPPRVRLAWTHRYRHLGFVGLAACQFGMMLQSISMQGVQPVLLRYFVDAGFAIGIAAWGVWQHKKDVQQEQNVRQANEDKLVGALEAEKGVR